jgi:MFS family permease
MPKFRYLVNKIGRVVMAISSAITLLVSGILPAMGPADSMVVLIIALALLGLGWNFGFIRGTAILLDATTPSSRGFPNLSLKRSKVER